MQTLQISQQKAFQLYPNASPEFKTMLEESFGKDFFSQKITDRVKTFEDACKVLGVPEPEFLIDNYKGLENDIKSLEAYSKLTLIARALNEGWKPDWNNSSQHKYVPWFKAKPSGSGLSYVDCAYWHTYTTVGSRLCYKSSELAIYAAQQFEALYNDFLTIQ